jgi:hypothetical protein
MGTPVDGAEDDKGREAEQFGGVAMEAPEEKDGEPEHHENGKRRALLDE